MAILVLNKLRCWYTISPHQGECFYLCLLLHNVKGPRSFADLKTVNGDLCNSLHEACLKLGLLEDDNQCCVRVGLVKFDVLYTWGFNVESPGFALKVCS